VLEDVGRAAAARGDGDPERQRHALVAAPLHPPHAFSSVAPAAGYRLATTVPAEPELRRETPCANAIFQQPWWLDAVAPRRWGETTVERDGRVIARLPYVVRGRRRMRVLTMPPLTQTLGPWVEQSAASAPRALSEELELLTALEAALPPAESFVQHFAPAMLNALPFHWAGYGLELQYTYRLKGLAEDAVWQGMRGNIRREIRKARKRVEVRDDLPLDRFHAVWAKTFERQQLGVPASLVQLDRLDAACAARGARALLSAHDDDDRIHAVAYVVWDTNAAFYLLGGGDPELRTSGASSLLLWEGIARARSVTDVFDFEGSMLAPVERYFRAFGARQTPYLCVSRASRRARAAFAARDAWRGLAQRRGATRRDG
jgi:Acetyltransferase (GNAT) domain